jgi:polygalacturonase
MEIRLLFKSARSAVIEIDEGGIYHTREAYMIMVNGETYVHTCRVITSLWGLKPDSIYHIQVQGNSGDRKELKFRTEREFVTLDVREFGAKGDGKRDDTLPIQAAIMACPKDGRVLIPKGTYRVTSIFLKSDLRLELAKNAVLLAETIRSRYPVFPGLIESYDETGEYNLGTWEGNPLPMFTGIITGINVENVLLYGEGTVDGRAGEGDWWENPKIMRGAFRPRLLFLNKCSNITVQGIHWKNSPAWTIHPYFSTNLTFLDLDINNPADSPNTDGLNPESCKSVKITGTKFSLGDDCIAIKSGKIYMGRKYKVPCENIEIRQCYMERGHGAVTIGSEMAAGVYQVLVKDCIFQSTDRGLRIKTRRGRGKDAIIDGIVFDHIHMKEVKTPFVVNCFYFCDPDGKTRETYPVDDRTPSIKKLTFTNIICEDCHVAAAYFYGLPEQKIEEVILDYVTVTYEIQPEPDVPAMTCGIKPRIKQGIFAANIKKLFLRDVSIRGQIGEALILQQIDQVDRAGFCHKRETKL